MKKKILNCILLFIFAFSAVNCAIAQDDSVESLRNKATILKKEIEKKEAILMSSQKDINSRLNNLKIITAKIDEYKGYVNLLKKEVNALDKKMTGIDKEMKTIDAEIKVKEKDVETSRAEYAEALRKSRKYSNFDNRLLFIFSANDFNTMARRYRYVNKYIDAQKALADSLKKDIQELEGKHNKLKAKRIELDKTRSAKKASLKEQEAERTRIEKLEKEQKGIIAGLEKEKSKVQAQLKKQRDELNRLNSAIKSEVDKVVSSGNTTKNSTSSNKKGELKKEDTSSYNRDSGIAKMSGEFQANKKKLPVPITGAYLLIDKFGERNAVEGKGSVMINNAGLTFKGTKGAKARSIFEGTVSTVFYHNDYICVLIRHDKYISVYCNIENVQVKGGDKIKAGDIIGDVAIDAEDGNPKMLFQLYREKTLLNPAEWLNI